MKNNYRKCFNPINHQEYNHKTQHRTIPPARTQAIYLLTLTTADGKQHTVRLLKQSDIFDE